MIDFKKYTHAALFAGGLLFGTAGLKLLSSKDAKNVYARTSAAGSPTPNTTWVRSCARLHARQARHRCRSCSHC